MHVRLWYQITCDTNLNEVLYFPAKNMQHIYFILFFMIGIPSMYGHFVYPLFRLCSTLISPLLFEVIPYKTQISMMKRTCSLISFSFLLYS
jgi:hypothetical protein